MGKHFSIQFKNDDSSAYILCTIHQWNDWPQIGDVVTKVKRAIARGTTVDYVVYVFASDLKVPQPWSLPLIAEFMATMSTIERPNVMVNAPRQLRVFVRMAQQVYGANGSPAQLSFVDNVKDASKGVTPHHAATTR